MTPEEENTAYVNAGGFIGELFAALISILILSLVYSPFVLAGGCTFYLCWKKWHLHGAVSAVFACLAALALYYFVALLEGSQQNLRRRKSKWWFAIQALNLIIVCGVPFAIGASIGLAILGKGPHMMFEQIVMMLFGGTILAAVSFANVFGKFRSCQKPDNATDKISFVRQQGDAQ